MKTFKLSDKASVTLDAAITDGYSIVAVKKDVAIKIIDASEFPTKSDVNSKLESSIFTSAMNVVNASIQALQAKSFKADDVTAENAGKALVVNSAGDGVELQSVPTKTSEITNDSDYTTQAYVDGIVGDVETLLAAL